MNTENLTIIRATITVDYIIPEYDHDIQATIKDWFYNPNYPVGVRHVYRDTNKVGFSEKVLEVKQMSMKEAYPKKEKQ
jgi:hypothetical protein